MFIAKGVDLSKPMVMSCMAGVMASMGYAGAVKAGFSGPLYLYDGSFSEFKDKSTKEKAEEGN